MKQILFEPFGKQKEFMDAVRSGKYRYLLYGGAIRGGKSYVAMATIIILARIFKGSRWAIVRKDLGRIRRNVVPTFEKIKPTNFVGPLNKSEWSYTCSNGSEILLVAESLKDDPDLDRFKGLEVNGFLLEEANELSEKTWNKCIERAGSWIIADGQQPPPLILLTTNPADNWVKRVFYDPWKDGVLKPPYFYLPANIFDNPYIPQEYLESIKNLPPKEYRRFVEGDWSQSDEPDQLIKYQWIREAYEIELQGGKQRLGVDVARFGDDETVLAKMLGNALVEIQGYKNMSIDRTATITQNKIMEDGIDADMVGIDVVGLGAGVVDNLRRAGYTVKAISSGEKPVHIPGWNTHFKFYNLRSQMWWFLREKLRNGEIAIAVQNQKLVEDLTAPRYEIRSDKTIRVESKDEIKKRLGRSTDYGDAFVYAMFVEYLASERIEQVEVF